MLLYLTFIRPFSKRSLLVSEILNELVIFFALLAVCFSHFIKWMDLFYLFCGFIGTVMAWGFGTSLLEAIKRISNRKASFAI